MNPKFFSGYWSLLAEYSKQSAATFGQLIPKITQFLPINDRSDASILHIHWLSYDFLLFSTSKFFHTHTFAARNIKIFEIRTEELA